MVVVGFIVLVGMGVVALVVGTVFVVGTCVVFVVGKVVGCRVGGAGVCTLLVIKYKLYTPTYITSMTSLQTSV